MRTLPPAGGQERNQAGLPRTTPGESSDARPRSPARNIIIAILAGLAINTLFGLFLDMKDIVAALSRFRLPMLLVPFFAIVTVYAIDSVRYMLIYRHFRVRLRFRDAMYNNILGYFVSGITPSSAGGQPFQVFHFVKLGMDSTAATNIVFSRLMVTNLAQLAVVLVFLKHGIEVITAAANGIFILALGLLTTFVISCILFLLFVKPELLGKLAVLLEGTRIGHFISHRLKDEHWAEKLSSWSLELRDSFRFLWTGRPAAMILDLVLFGADQVIWAWSLYFPIITLTGSSLNFGGFLFAYILCGLVSAYIPTPGASGSIETAYALVLSGVTNAPGAVLSAILVWRVGSYYLHLLLGGLVYSLWKVPTGCYRRQEDGIMRHIHGHGSHSCSDGKSPRGFWDSRERGVEVSSRSGNQDGSEER